MSEIKAMTKRNLLIYFRNKSAVFFSIANPLMTTLQERQP